MTQWIPTPSPSQRWLIDRGRTIRISEEPRRVRVTEDGRIRIIERFRASWLRESEPFDTWTRE